MELAIWNPHPRTSSFFRVCSELSYLLFSVTVDKLLGQMKKKYSIVSLSSFEVYSEGAASLPDFFSRARNNFQKSQRHKILLGRRLRALGNGLKRGGRS